AAAGHSLVSHSPERLVTRNPGLWHANCQDSYSIFKRITFHTGVTGQNEYVKYRSISGFRAVYAGSGTLLLRSVEQCNAELCTEVPHIPTSTRPGPRTGRAQEWPGIQFRLRSHTFIFNETIPRHARGSFRAGSVIFVRGRMDGAVDVRTILAARLDHKRIAIARAVAADSIVRASVLSGYLLAVIDDQHLGIFALLFQIQPKFLNSGEYRRSRHACFDLGQQPPFEPRIVGASESGAVNNRTLSKVRRSQRR